VPITIKVTGAKELNAALASAPKTLEDETHRAMSTGLLLLEADMKRATPRDTGRLQGSIHHTITGSGASLTGKVGSSQAYGVFVEKGARAHFPPIAAISGWARRHGVPPFLVARAIARRGTKAQPFMEPAFHKNRARIEQLFEKIGLQVAQHIAGGR